MKAKARGGRICLRLALHPPNSPSRPIASSIWALSALRNCSWRVAASSRARRLPRQLAMPVTGQAIGRSAGPCRSRFHHGRRRSSALDPAGWPRPPGIQMPAGATFIASSRRSAPSPRAVTSHARQDRRKCGPENRADGLLSVELTGRPQHRERHDTNDVQGQCRLA